MQNMYEGARDKGPKTLCVLRVEQQGQVGTQQAAARLVDPAGSRRGVKRKRRRGRRRKGYVSAHLLVVVGGGVAVDVVVVAVAVAAAVALPVFVLFPCCPSATIFALPCSQLYMSVCIQAAPN